MSKQVTALYRSVQSAKRKQRVIEIAYDLLVNVGKCTEPTSSQDGIVGLAIQRFERETGLRLTNEEVTDVAIMWRAHVSEAMKVQP